MSADDFNADFGEPLEQQAAEHSARGFAFTNLSIKHALSEQLSKEKQGGRGSKEKQLPGLPPRPKKTLHTFSVKTTAHASEDESRSAQTGPSKAARKRSSSLSKKKELLAGFRELEEIKERNASRSSSIGGPRLMPRISDKNSAAKPQKKVTSKTPGVHRAPARNETFTAPASKPHPRRPPPLFTLQSKQSVVGLGLEAKQSVGHRLDRAERERQELYDRSELYDYRPVLGADSGDEPWPFDQDEDFTIDVVLTEPVARVQHECRRTVGGRRSEDGVAGKTLLEDGLSAPESQAGARERRRGRRRAGFVVPRRAEGGRERPEEGAEEAVQTEDRGDLPAQVGFP